MYLCTSSHWDCRLNIISPLGKCVLVDKGVQNTDGVGGQVVGVGMGHSTSGAVIRW